MSKKFPVQAWLRRWEGKLWEPSTTGPASVRSIRAVAKKLRKVRQEIIERADRNECRFLLPLVESYLQNCKVHPTKLQLLQMSSLLDSIEGTAKMRAAGYWKQ